ncbi:isoleucine--tRNA ligase, partial [candidate division WWE3 bacterium RIFOXYD1_FULL_39_9]
MFKVPENKSIQEMESDVSAFWKSGKIFEKSVDSRPKENRYVFYDGPPFISGLPHYGHLLGSIAKDIIPRYWTMKGKRVERVWGWDAHGLTVENKVQARLGIKGRRDIEAFGLEKFVQECYKYTSEISAEWVWYIDKIGRWVDMDHAYKTIDQTYMESVMWAFKRLYEKGLVYEGVYTSLFCTTCGTPVSNFEIAMDNTYKDFEDPAITVKFPVTTAGEFEGASILAWTTTPWTIPSNRALVVDENETYVLFEFEQNKYIAAKKRIDSIVRGAEYKIISEFTGKKLIGLSYNPPYNFYTSKQGEYQVYSFEGMVNMEDGTGVVHSAPGFGEVDTAMGRHYDLNIMLSLNDEGKFEPGTSENNPFEGMFYTKANPIITQDLADKKLLFRGETITHRVPYHDRCNTILIQRAQNSWFVNIDKMKDDMLKNNEEINWVPEHLKEGRFKIGIVQAPDWCVSRTRFWATPMPVWKSEDGEIIVVGSLKELEELSGKQVKDLHRPYIDEITLSKNGKTFRRIPEVLDSWFEAGSMPYAQLHYPMENQEIFEKNFPGDYIVEYIAQTRAWFFFMHALSTGLFGTSSFKNVISTGVMAGSDGRKMSKTYGNYTDPKLVLEKIGGDATRLYLMGSPLMVGENANFDDDELRTKLRNVLNPLWNSVKFFLIYAVQFDWKPENSEISTNPLDKWIVARLHETIKTFSASIEAYSVPAAVSAVEGFVDDLSRWYVRRSRDRISSGDNAALSTFYSVLKTFSQAAAPLIPFITETIYQTLKTEKDTGESVHLCDYPLFDEKLIDESAEMLKLMQVLRDYVSIGHASRVTAGIAVRQPLQKILVI